jgi:thiol-disulfide isomerase/thioredoxin
MAKGCLLFAGLCCFCVVFAGCGKPGDENNDVTVNPPTDPVDVPVEGKTDEPAAEDKEAAPAGDIELTAVSWEQMQAKIAENKGKVVVLDAWSTSCGPCMKEFPNLVALHNKYADGDVVCISMSVDYDGIPNKPPEYYRERVLKFLTKMNSTMQNYQLNQEATEWFDSVGLGAIPAVFVYGRDGELKKRFDNDSITKSDEAFTYEQVNQLVEELLAK